MLGVGVEGLELMENGVRENPLMLKTFEFVAKVNILNIELIFIL